MTFAEICDEVKRRGIRNQGGTGFDIGIKRLINVSLFRLAGEAPWRSLRRKSNFTTVNSYTKGTTATTTTSSNIVTLAAGATLLTDKVQIGRRIKFGSSSTFYYITAITAEDTLNIDVPFRAATNTATNYEILPQDEYNLPIQGGHRMFMWHEDFGFPFKMVYIPSMQFFEIAYYLTIKNVPTHYRMWGENMVIEQLRTASNIAISSSSAADTSIPVTIFGDVAGYPDYELIYTNSTDGTTSTTTSNVFSSIERVVKGSASVGRITATANSANTTVAVMPRGDTTEGIQYKKVNLYPLPQRVFKMWVQYYKTPYRLVNDGDVHEMGEEFDEALILLATAKLKAEQNLQTEADRFYALYNDELKTLRKTNMDKIDWFPRLQKPWQSNSSLLVHPNLLYGQVGASFGPASRR